MPERVVVAMSGGVDSSVAAYLLRQEGYEVVGMTLKTWPKELCDTVPKGQTCCSARDIEDARRVADQMEIPFFVVEAAEPFKQNVMDYFLDSYAHGRTPNPCVVCNRKIKSGLLLERAAAFGARWLATGHYAQVGWDEQRGRYAIRQAVDGEKDQSYALFQLTQEQLSRLLLPMGSLTKLQVRELAHEAGLEVADKPESMELCFIPDGDTQGFLRARIPEAFRPGEITDAKGNVLGTHQGIAAYTVGQRRGLGIAHSQPLYVLAVNPSTRRIVVGERRQLAADSCQVEELHWSGVPALEEPREAWVKIRYRAERVRARLIPAGNEVRVEFLEPVEGGLSPGQAAVFYEDGTVLGGGWIKK